MFDTEKMYENFLIMCSDMVVKSMRDTANTLMAMSKAQDQNEGPCCQWSTASQQQLIHFLSWYGLFYSMYKKVCKDNHHEHFRMPASVLPTMLYFLAMPCQIEKAIAQNVTYTKERTTVC